MIYLLLTHYLLLAQDRGHESTVITFDLRAALDFDNHRVLIFKFQSLGDGG